MAIGRETTAMPPRPTTHLIFFGHPGSWRLKFVLFLLFIHQENQQVLFLSRIPFSPGACLSFLICKMGTRTGRQYE